MLIATARSGDVTDVHVFHLSHTTEFMWPRTSLQLEELADQGALLVARGNDVARRREYIVSMCYVMEGEEPEGGRRWEFGGIYVSDEFRGYGIGSALGTLMISSHYLAEHDEPPQIGERLIAHVHEYNSDPRPMLEAHLGFVQVGKETPPSDVVPPPSLRRNPNGEVVADLYEFRISTLGKFADWLEIFDGRVKGRNGSLTAILNLSLFSPAYRVEAIELLRQLASSG